VTLRGIPRCDHADIEANRRSSKWASISAASDEDLHVLVVRGGKLVGSLSPKDAVC